MSSKTKINIPITATGLIIILSVILWPDNKIVTDKNPRSPSSSTIEDNSRVLHQPEPPKKLSNNNNNSQINLLTVPFENQSRKEFVDIAKFSQSESRGNWWDREDWQKNVLLKKNPQIYHRNNGNPQNITTLIKSLRTDKDLLMIHSIRLNGAPDDLVPSGRIGDYLRRDEGFYANALIALKDKVVTNSLFFNYTGHQGPVAAALSEKGIGSSWNLTLNERIADQMQDWAPLISKNKVDPKLNSHGIILESSHALGMDGNGVIDDSKLPTPQELKRLGISRVVVFTEDNFNSNVNVNSFQKTNKEFSSYLEILQNNDLKLEFIGLDFNGSSTK